VQTNDRIATLVIAQTGSVVLGLLGMAHIMFSFTLAYFVYGVVLGFRWFPFLNLLGCEPVHSAPSTAVMIPQVMCLQRLLRAPEV
jgi:hypothetical protein